MIIANGKVELRDASYETRVEVKRMAAGCEWILKRRLRATGCERIVGIASQKLWIPGLSINVTNVNARKTEAREMTSTIVDIISLAKASG